MSTLRDLSSDENIEILQQIERIQNHRNVHGLILVNTEGNPVRSNMDNSTSLQYTRHMEELKNITEHIVRDLDPNDELVVLRIRNKLNEVMVLPEQGNLVICVQAREDRFDENEPFLNDGMSSIALQFSASESSFVRLQFEQDQDGNTTSSNTCEIMKNTISDKVNISTGHHILVLICSTNQVGGNDCPFFRVNDLTKLGEVKMLIFPQKGLTAFKLPVYQLFISNSRDLFTTPESNNLANTICQILRN